MSQAKQKQTSGEPDRSRLHKPRIASKMVLARTELRDALADIAVRTGASEKELEREAARYLHELMPRSSRFGYRMMIAFARFAYRRGYDKEIACDPAEVERFRGLVNHNSVALLGNHRSQMDGWAVYAAMHKQNLPHPFSFGGINMKLPIWGTLLKSSRLIFLRRAFHDNLVYKAVLRTYIDFLVENRFPLYWSIEGTRSRTGKLAAPRFGLVNWVLDAQLRLSGEDLFLVPVVVSYEQIEEVQSYSDEQTGVKKQPENFAWMLKYLSGFKNPMGQISVHFGDAVSVQQQMAQIRRDTPDLANDRDKVLLKIVIAACLQMNQATPVTVTSLICLVLLQAAPKAVSWKELEREFFQLVAYVKANGWLTTFDLDKEPELPLKHSLVALANNGVIEGYDKGAEPVYSICPGKNLIASYYRNNSIHFLVNGAIAELALAEALSEQVPAHREAKFWGEVKQLRRLFKFEFYFPPKEQLNHEIQSDLDLRCPRWRELLASPDPFPGRELHNVTPLLCHGVFESYVDAYQIVANNLVRRPPGDSFDQAAIIDQCLGEAEQLFRLKRISHHESAAKAMFESGLLVAKNRGLLDSETNHSKLISRRQEFLEELNGLSGRLQNIRHIAAARRFG